LGSHLMLHHLKQGDIVLGVDNFCSSKEKSPQLTQINAFPRGRIAFHDITDHLAELYRRISEFRRNPFAMAQNETFDVIYNFACPASPPIYQSMPIETMMTCTLGTKNMLELARQHGAVLVHASTSEVYGDPESSPQSEVYKGNVNSYGPRACYDEGKRAAEALCYDFLHRYNTDARLVRIFNTYGPHMDPYDGRVVSNFINQALIGEPLTIYGDGQQTRSFCYVDDLIRGIVTMGEIRSNPGVPINLGNPNEFTVNALAAAVVRRLGGTVTRKPLPIDDPTQRKPDITRAQSFLDWVPTIELEEGIDRTVEYFKRVV